MFEELEREAYDLLESRPDQNSSFVEGKSFVVMKDGRCLQWAGRTGRFLIYWRGKADEEQFVTLLDRITIDPMVFGGKPCIRGMRFPVSKLLDLVASGMSQAEIVEDYPYLEEEDIRQALKYAAWVVQEERVEIS